jgi:hypothetical protein
MVALLACLAASGVLLAADRVLGLGLFPDAISRQMKAAAEAVVPGGDDEDSVGYVRASESGGLGVGVPALVQFNRARVVGLAVELDRERSLCEQAVGRLLALHHLNADEGEIAQQAERVLRIWGVSSSRLGRLLALEPGRARTCLAALGWPWLGDGPEGLRVEALGHMFPARPGVLRAMMLENWLALLEQAGQPRPWPELRQVMMPRYGLTDGQMRALQAYIVRRDVLRAFSGKADDRRARETLARLAALTPGQEAALLSMAGVRELLGSGGFGFPALIDMLEGRPELALPLLKECVYRAAVPEQALRAAARLQGRFPEDAEETLVALGPFGAQAVRALGRSVEGTMNARARAVLARIHEDWPDEEDALKLLGTSPGRWRRWHRRARRVL